VVRAEMRIPEDVMGRILLLSAVLLILFTGTDVLSNRLSVSSPLVLRELPYRISGWVGEDKIIPNPVLLKLGVDDSLMREYIREDSRFWLYIGYYRSQKGSKTIHSPKHCYPAAGWEKIESSIIPIKVTARNLAEDTITVNRYLLGKDGERELVYYWYQTGETTEVDEIGVLIDRLKNSLMRNRTDGALIRLSARIRGENIADEERMRDSIPLIYSFMNQNSSR